MDDGNGGDKKGARAVIDALCVRMRSCQGCALRLTSTQVVPGEGSENARILFIGEGPGEDEDIQGRPFVGRTGQLLRDNMFRTGVAQYPHYITNTVKCRPPENREPNPDECAACWPWTEALIDILRPRVIVPLGRPALTTIAARLGFTRKIGQNKITKLAGVPIHLDQGIYIYPMFHPSYAARRSDARAEFHGHLLYLQAALPGWLARPEEGEETRAGEGEGEGRKGGGDDASK